MLVLTRKQGKSVVIRIPPSSEPREVRLIVDRIEKPQNGQPSARMMFETDARDIVILREELIERSKDAHDTKLD